MSESGAQLHKAVISIFFPLKKVNTLHPLTRSGSRATFSRK